MSAAKPGYDVAMDATRSLARLLPSAGGAALGAVFSVVSRIRPAAKPLHPRGRLVSATVRRTGLDPPVGVAWLDEPGRDDVLARVSRAVGLPPPVPDIGGLAVRVLETSGREADLLFATTGMGALSRYLLRFSSSPHTRPHSTLLPYRTPSGAVVLAAVPWADGAGYELLCADAAGPWRRFGQLELEQAPPGAPVDALVSFDPIRNTLPGLEPLAWVRRLREPAYASARRARGDRIT